MQLKIIPLNGKFPFNDLKSRIPRAQVSTGKVQSFLFTISGAIQLGVPQKIFNFVPGAKAIEKPKSINLTF